MTEKQLLKFIQKSEFDIQSARACFLACDIWFRVYAESKLFQHNLPLEFGYFKTFNNREAFYQITPKNDMQAFCRDVYWEYLKTPEKLLKKIAIRDTFPRKIDVLWKKYSRLKQPQREESAAFFEKFIRLMNKWITYAMIGEDKWKVIEEEFIPSFAVKNNLTETEIRNRLAVLSHPEEIGIFTLERKLFLKICEYVFSRKILQKAVRGKNFQVVLKDIQLSKFIEEYRKKFFWIKTDFYNLTEITPSVLLEDIRKEIITKNSRQIKKELQEISFNVIALQKEKKKIAAELKINKKDQRALELLKSAVIWHDNRKEDMMKHFYYLFSIIKNLVAVTGLNYDYLGSFTLEEFRDFLKADCRPIKKPQAVFTIYAQGKKLEYFYGATADKLLQAVLKVGKKIKELSGVVASQGQGGHIQGRVRVIIDPKKDKFSKGDILVTSMTRVEFVPLMRIAKAVITDEGGLACHAAIISRELNLPCIIGTKIATKVLHDGDLVEMDMDRGIVKILKQYGSK